MAGRGPEVHVVFFCFLFLLDLAVGGLYPAVSVHGLSNISVFGDRAGKYSAIGDRGEKCSVTGDREGKCSVIDVRAGKCSLTGEWMGKCSVINDLLVLAAG